MRYTAHVLVLTVLVTIGAVAQAPPAQPVDVERIGPMVDEIVPSFAAPDQFGRVQTLESILGPNGAMLSFNRSADW